METLTTIASRREERDYRPDPIPESVVDSILKAGRIAGSAMNRQPCRFTCVRPEADFAQEISRAITRPANVAGATLLVCVSMVEETNCSQFDAGRAIQNMLLAAWDHRVGSCPNTIKEPEVLRGLLGICAEEDLVTLLSFGYLRSPRNVEGRSVEEWFERANRLPLDTIVRWGPSSKGHS